jgi:hypothetical protein
VQGRTSYTREEVDNAKALIDRQVNSYKALSRFVAGDTDVRAKQTVGKFEPHFTNLLIMELDRIFVLRLPSVAGRDGNALSEVELLSDSIAMFDGVLTEDPDIPFSPADSVTKVNYGDHIRLILNDFERLQRAFFAELEKRFVNGTPPHLV